MSRDRTIPLRAAIATPLVATAACFAAGILVGHYAEPGLRLAYALASVALLAWIWWERCATFLLFAFAAGGLLHLLQTGADRDAAFLAGITDGAVGATVVGVVVSPPKDGSGKRPHTRFHLQLEQVTIGGKTTPAQGHRIYVDFREPPPTAPITYGDRIRLQGTLRTPRPPRNPAEFDFAKFLSAQGIYAELLCAERGFERLDTDRGNPLVAFGLRTRDRISRQITRGIGADDTEAAALILAMTLGMRDDTPDYLEDKFRYSGTLHVFAVSGLHVGIVATVVWFAMLMLAPVVGLPQKAAIVAVIVAMLAYALVTGLRPSACRAAIMGAVFFAGMLIGREPQVVNSTAAAALAILLPDTGQLFRPGFQLSFLVLLSIALMAKTVSRYLSRPLYPDAFLPSSLVPRRRHALFAAARKGTGLTAVSTAAWVGSSPLTWLYFGLITPISIVANLLLIPLAFVVLGTAAFSVALALVPHPLPAELANEANALWAKTAATTAGAFSEIPGGHWIVPAPTHLLRSECEINVLDLPYGGAAAHVALPGWGGHWLLDTGSDPAFRRKVHPLLRAYGCSRLDGLLLSHGDVEHVGGAATAIQEYTPRQLLTTAANSTSPSWRTALATARELGIPLGRPTPGDRIDLGRGTTLTILYPPAKNAPGFVADDRSLVVQLRLANGCRLLFLSDSGFYTEGWLLDHTDPETLRSDILIKGQNANDLPMLPGLIDAISPRAVIFNGADKATLARFAELEQNGVALFAQEQTGAVLVRTRGPNTLIKAFLNDQTTLLKP